MASEVDSYITYLSRHELYQTEKPYCTDFLVETPTARMTNHYFDVRPVKVYDARKNEKPFSLDCNGFCFVKAETDLQAQDATSERTLLMEAYTQQIARIVQATIPEYTEVRVMDFQVRQRDPTFPSTKTEDLAEFAQPSTMAHTDFSPTGAFMRMNDVFTEENKPEYQNGGFDLINVWRVLRGPNNDWPLALCDYTHVEETDITTNDALHYKRVGENLLLYHNDAHKWYYLSDMMEDDLIVFRNTDSEGKLSKCFHASFYNPNSTGELRHSIEVRLVGCRD